MVDPGGFAKNFPEINHVDRYTRIYHMRKGLALPSCKIAANIARPRDLAHPID